MLQKLILCYYRITFSIRRLSSGSLAYVGTWIPSKKFRPQYQNFLLGPYNLLCKQIIMILIASNIEFVISNMKPRFDVLIKSQLPWDQKHLPTLLTIDFFFLSFVFGTRQRNSIYRIVYRIHQRNRQQHDNWYALSINVKLNLATWFDLLRLNWDSISFYQNSKRNYNK